MNECVVCVGDEDCVGEETCGSDHQCHKQIPCSSDKECKDFGLVCNKETGICVECLAVEDCPDDEYCHDEYCMPDMCEAGKAHCDGKQVITCNDEGSAEEATMTCTEKQYCEAGVCQDHICTPSDIWCDGDVLKTCSDDGKTVENESDCSEQSMVCIDGACLDCLCIPNAKYCEDDTTVAECSENCVDYSVVSCPQLYFCDLGECLPAICTPDSKTCIDNKAMTCNSKGSEFLMEEDCSATKSLCFEGVCIDNVCPPNQLFCEDDATKATCSADGMEYVAEACPAEHYCEAGECLPWVCTPGEPFCEANIAKVCNDMGSSVLTEQDCEAKVCIDGACTDCQPQCDGKECGDDGCGGMCGDCEPGQVCINGKCPEPGQECDDGNDVDWDGCTNGQITEFQVNTVAKNYQHRPDVGFLSDGQFVVVWDGFGEYAQDEVFSEIHGRVFAPDSDEPSEEFQVNSWTLDQQEVPKVSCLPGGRFVVVWGSYKQDGDSYGVVGQCFTEDGTKTGSEFPVNTYTENAQSSARVASLSNDRFVVVWRSYEQDGSNYGVFGRFFNSEDCTPDGGEFQVNAVSFGYQSAPFVASRGSAGFVATWTGGDVDKNVYGKLYDNEGLVILSDFVMNTYQNSSQSSSCLTPLSDGGFLALWSSFGQDGDGSGIFSQTFDQNGQKTGQELGVNKSTSGDQKQPAAATDPSGRTMIVWTGQYVASTPHDVFALVLDPQGQVVVDEFQVNIQGTDNQTNSCVAASSNGGFVVVWESNQQVPILSKDVFAQRFDSEGSRLYH